MSMKENSIVAETRGQNSLVRSMRWLVCVVSNLFAQTNNSEKNAVLLLRSCAFRLGLTSTVNSTYILDARRMFFSVCSIIFFLDFFFFKETIEKCGNVSYIDFLGLDSPTVQISSSLLLFIHIFRLKYCLILTYRQQCDARPRRMRTTSWQNLQLLASSLLDCCRVSL